MMFTYLFSFEGPYFISGISLVVSEPNLRVRVAAEAYLVTLSPTLFWKDNVNIWDGMS